MYSGTVQRFCKLKIHCKIFNVLVWSEELLEHNPNQFFLPEGGQIKHLNYGEIRDWNNSRSVHVKNMMNYKLNITLIENIYFNILSKVYTGVHKMYTRLEVHYFIIFGKKLQVIMKNTISKPISLEPKLLFFFAGPLSREDIDCYWK